MSVVYFIGCAELRRVKIGTTNNLERRLGHLKTSAPAAIELLATEPGGVERERELHDHFAAARINGEWFEIDAVSDYIAALPPLPVKVKPLGPTELSRLTGWSKAYCHALLNSDRSITVGRAVYIHERTGLRFGPIAAATDHEIAILRKFLPSERASLVAVSEGVLLAGETA